MEIPEILRTSIVQQISDEMSTMYSSEHPFAGVLDDPNLTINEKVKILETYKGAVTRGVKNRINNWEDFKKVNINATIVRTVKQFWDPSNNKGSMGARQIEYVNKNGRIRSHSYNSIGVQQNMAIYNVFQQYLQFLNQIITTICSLENVYSKTFQQNPQDAIKNAIVEWSKYSENIKNELALVTKNRHLIDESYRKLNGHWFGIEYDSYKIDVLEDDILYWSDSLLKELKEVQQGKIVPPERIGAVIKDDKLTTYIVRSKGQYDFSKFTNSLEDSADIFRELCKRINNLDTSDKPINYIKSIEYAKLFENARTVYEFERLEETIIKLKTPKKEFAGILWVGNNPTGQLDYLYEQLVNRSIILTTKEIFLKVFTPLANTDNELINTPPRITWLLKEVDLVFFIIKLYLEEFIPDDNYNAKIKNNLLFVDKDGNKYESFRKNKSTIFKDSKDMNPDQPDMRPAKTMNSPILNKIIIGLIELDKK